MAIKSVELENFTVLENVKCDFSPGINIIIGENGTGKTHLLKVLYAFCSCKAFPHHLSNEQSEFKDGFTILLSKCFQDKKITQLFTSENKRMYIGIESREGLFPLYCTNDKSENGVDRSYIDFSFFNETNEKQPIPSIFLTAKEMLSHSRGLTSLYNEYELPFDATQIDIISKAQFPVARSIPNIAKNILPHLENILEGKVVEESDEFFIEKRDGRKVPFALEAEGVKKIGVLWKLLISKRIETDTVLFWDEPEANINPTIMPVVVSTLLALSRQGVQVFVSTHDYLFAKYFEVRRTEDDLVRFHSLYKSNEGAKYEFNENFRDLKENPLIAAYDDLLDEVIRLNLGD